MNLEPGTLNNKRRIYNIIFYVLVASGILFIFLSNPFVVKTYDVEKYHLPVINDFYLKGSFGGDYHDIWHFIWASIFRFTGINDLFVWAKIIHVTQFLLAAVMVFYFAKTVLAILIKKTLLTHSDMQNDESNPPFNKVGNKELVNEKDRIRIKFLSLLAVFLWFIGNGTHAGDHQQAWIMWYSVTYQCFTMPLLWFSIALTMKIFYEPLPNVRRLLFLALVILTALIIARVHPLETVYYLIIVSVLLILNMRRMVLEKNRIIFFGIPIFFILALIIIKYVIVLQPHIFKLVSENSFTQILIEINKTGYDVVKLDIFNEIFLVNHFDAAFSEVARISILLALLFRIYYIFKKKAYMDINIKIYDALLVLSLLFYLIPCIPFLAGVAAYITDVKQVYRFFYAPPWFIFLPFLGYEMMKSEKIRKILTENPIYRLLIKNEEITIHSEKRFIALSAISIIVIVLLIFIVPKKISFKNSILRTFLFKTTISNTESLINSLDKEKVFNLQEKI